MSCLGGDSSGAILFVALGGKTSMRNVPKLPCFYGRGCTKIRNIGVVRRGAPRLYVYNSVQSIEY